MSLGTWLITFSAMFILDVCWVLYTRSAMRNNSYQAALWALMLHLFSATATLAYVDDKRYLTATALGTLLGTFAVVEWSRRKDKCT